MRALHEGWIDVSVTLADGMVHWPGDPPVEIDRVQQIADGDEANLTRLRLSAHTGTHMDAPVHFIEGAPDLEQLPLAATLGPARVIDIADPLAVRPEELDRHDIRTGERVLLRTRNSARPWAREPFDETFVYIAVSGARWLAERGVRTVGIDYLSVGGFAADGAQTHRVLLEAGIWIIEGLDLSQVTAGDYELLCLPLRLAHADGAPARALLRPRQ